jgi:rhodanese-related sulfurtransferase
MATAGCFFPGAIEDLDVKQMESSLKGEKKPVIIDNRTEMEFSYGHIPGAINIPQQNFPIIASFLPSDKDTPLIFYCGGYS